MRLEKSLLMCKGGNDKKCFVISPIGEEYSDIRKRSDQIFTYIIEKAVTRFGYCPVRADKIPRPGIITSQIIEHILNDDLVVADLTGKNPNVFYELAIRHAVKKPFIQIKEVTETIPFDIAGMRTINVDYRFIEGMDKCKEEIIKQIKEIEDNPDSVTETPISFTLNYSQVRDNTDPQSRLLKSLTSQIEALSSELDMLRKQNSVKNENVMNVRPSIDDTARDEKLILHNFLQELCKRDKDAQANDHPVEFNIDEIISANLAAFSKNYVYQFILKFEKEYGYIEVVDSNRIRLTEIGRNFCR